MSLESVHQRKKKNSAVNITSKKTDPSTYCCFSLLYLERIGLELFLLFFYNSCMFVEQSSKLICLHCSMANALLCTLHPFCRWEIQTWKSLLPTPCFKSLADKSISSKSEDSMTMQRLICTICSFSRDGIKGRNKNCPI